MFSRFKKSGLASQVAAKLERHLYPHPLDQDSSLIEGKKLRATHGDFPNLNRLYSTPLSATDLIPSPAFSFHPHSSLPISLSSLGFLLLPYPPSWYFISSLVFASIGDLGSFVVSNAHPHFGNGCLFLI